MFSGMQKIVLSYPKLRERIESRDKPQEEKNKVLGNLDEIKANFSMGYIKTFVSFLDATLPQLYDGVEFDEGGVNIQALLKDHCVVLVPNHQSHADYLTINYSFYKKYKSPLFVAGGVNLNMPVIGPFFRKMGCFFIRRSFHSDVSYKLTLEAYLYYLMKKKRPIEFFFEGGRSRTGKLRSPRFGLFNMLLEVHKEINKNENLPLVFVPVSIVHEYIPETSSLTKELGGKKKKKENLGQVLKLVGLFAYQFGTVQIKLGKPIYPPEFNEDNLREKTHDIAFKCFREVGRNMMVTPSSLLAMVLLDDPSGAMPWQDIFNNAEAIINYCKKYDVPMTKSLQKTKFKKSLERAMDIFIGNKRVDVIGREHHGHLYYSIREECRGEILHSKNTIIHHFIIPAIISYAWVGLFSGEIKDVKDLKQFFLRQRSQLKHEFYLPTVKQFFYKTLSILGDIVGRRITTLEELMAFDNKELYTIASQIGIFNRALSYIYEGYYTAAVALQSLDKEYPDGFKFDQYEKMARKVFESEVSLGRVIRYREGHSPLLVNNALRYFTHLGMIQENDRMLSIANKKEFKKMVDGYEKDLRNQLAINVRGINS
jgi:glycerol-3-phosphate O-acyltransferase